MSRNHRPQTREIRHAPARHVSERTILDFNARERLEKIIRSRPIVEGITIDPYGTHIIDDGLWIRPHDKGWLIKTSVADLPALIPHGHHLEDTARSKMKEGYSRDEGVDRIWPVDMLDEFVSLRAGKARPAITFAITLDKDLEVARYKINRTAFENQGEHHDGPFYKYPDFSPRQQQEWRTLAQALYRKRNRDLGRAFDRVIDPGGVETEASSRGYKGDMADGKLMVHEVMRLTNRVATDFLRERDVLVPFKEQYAEIRPTFVSSDFNFDLVCNKACENLAKTMTEKSLPYVHLNSPMRRYTDYLALKILGREISGVKQDLAIKNEVMELTKNFNRRATNTWGSTLQSSWLPEWRQLLRLQEGAHLFDSAHPVKGRPSTTVDLKNLCRDNKWDRPLIAERQISVQNARLYFVGMSMNRTGSGLGIQAWAVSHDQEHALEIASGRMLKSLTERGFVPPAVGLAPV